ncbi:hypothetical protein [Streptosporangium sp. NPDC000396]|uniref:hypothetical protein n=1 Tax=Streptosporangium sp. NPDC000396 TaxID=3366185 RepID=UPI00367CCC33
MGAAPPDEGGPPAEPRPLREARREVERATAEYERARRGGGSPAELISAREAWSRALTVWARALIAREEAQDRMRLAALDDWETPGMHVAPAAGAPREGALEVWEGGEVA